MSRRTPLWRTLSARAILSDGIMHADGVVEIFRRKFRCLDKGFAPMRAGGRGHPAGGCATSSPLEQGQLVGTVTNVTFKGVHYDIIVDFYGFKWLIQTTRLLSRGRQNRHPRSIRTGSTS